MQKYIDVIIPRGGKSLIKKVKLKSKVPTIGHLEGICHVFVDKDSSLDMAIKVVRNAKMRKSVCTVAAGKRFEIIYFMTEMNTLRQSFWDWPFFYYLEKYCTLKHISL